MANKEQIDQDALAAEWGLALESDAGTTPANAETAAATGTDEAAEQWAAMVDDSGGLQSAKGGAERILNQEEIDSLLGFSLADETRDGNSGIRAIINSAMVSYERLPMLEIVFDRLVRLMTTSLRNFTSDNVEVSLDQHHVGAFRRLPQFNSAAGNYGSVPGGGVGQFRSRHRQFELDLFDHRCAAGRPARAERDPSRRQALHHDRDQSGQANDRGGAG